jgi:two-component system chemotaxis response regulator CheY
MNMAAASAESDPALVKLPSILDLAAAASLQEAALRAISASGRVHFDASQVDVVLLPCLQLILAAMRSANVAIERPSPALENAFAEFGLDFQTLVAAAAAMPVAAPHAVIPQEQVAQPEMTRTELPAIAEMAMQPALAESDPIEVPTGPLRILTIDDSKTMRDMLMLTLADAGFDVLQAVDGQDGVDLAERENFDIVITDINMPRMDGYEVIRQLRKRPEHKATPILVLTTESETDKKTIAREAGATGWLVKPFDPDKLIATVRKVAG